MRQQFLRVEVQVVGSERLLANRASQNANEQQKLRRRRLTSRHIRRNFNSRLNLDEVHATSEMKRS